jgi:aminopeptidase N
MLERWIGAEEIRDAMRSYVRTFEHQAVTTEDLLTLLDRETGKSVKAVTQRFLDSPGLPDLEFDIECKPNQSPKLTVTQRSSRTSDAQSLPWHIPVCVRYGQPTSTMKSCFELKDLRGEIELAGAVCPTWFYGNDQQLGYYSWHSNDQWLNKLLEHLPALSSVERATLPALLRRRAEAGVLPLKTYVDVLSRFVKADEVAF